MRIEVQVSIKNKLLAYAFNQSKIITWGGFENCYKDILVNFVKDEYLKYSSSYFPSSYTVEELNKELSEILTELYFYLKNNIQEPSGIDAKIFHKLYTQPLTSWRINNSDVFRYGNMTWFCFGLHFCSLGVKAVNQFYVLFVTPLSIKRIKTD